MAQQNSGGKKLVRSKSGLRIIASSDNGKSPFELSEPSWIPDIESPDCMQCQAKFDFMKRRHHCRRCGRIYCSNCCESKLPLTRMCFVDPVRLCESCAEVTRKENEFFDRHLKILLNGANFMVASTLNDSENESLPFFVKLASDQRDLMFDGGDNYKHSNIQLYDISSVQVEKTADEYSATWDYDMVELNSGNMSSTSVNLKFKDLDLLDHFMKLTAASVPNKKQSIAWITALQKALKLIYESKASQAPP